MRRPFLLFTLVLLTFNVQGGEPAVRSARGDWPQWRGNPQHTGWQGVAGDITHPAAHRLIYLGGRITEREVIPAGSGPACREGVIVLAPAGALEARCGSRVVWRRRYRVNTNLVAVRDLDGDGAAEVLASSVHLGIARLELFEAATGALRWSAQADANAAEAIAFGDVDGDGLEDLVWAPSGASIVRGYSFRNGVGRGFLLWYREIADYVSDPYGPSPIAIGDVLMGGGPEILIAGGRQQFEVIVLSGITGEILERRDFSIDAAGVRLTEGGGEGQLLAIRDLDGDGDREFVVIGSYSSTERYMFQGAIIGSANDLFRLRIFDAHPNGWRFVNGSLDDFDRSGTTDLLYSHFDSDAATWITEILDLAALRVLGVLKDARIEGIVPSSGGTIALIARGSHEESGRGKSSLEAFLVDDARLGASLWSVGAGEIVTLREPAHRSSTVANPGSTVLTLDATGDGNPGILIRNQGLVAGSDTLRLVSSLTGKELASHETQKAEHIAFVESGPSPNTVTLVLQSGTIAILDSSLMATQQFEAGGYYRGDAANGHAYDAAIVADLDGDSVNEIIVADARRNLIRLDGRTGNTSVLFDSIVSQDPVVVGRSIILRGCEELSSLCLASADGSVTWSLSLPDAGEELPIGTNAGRLGPDAVAGFVVSSPPGYPMTTVAVALDGRVLWTAPRGTYWNATFALADINHDGVDDAIYNYNAEKGFVIDGIRGRVLSQPAFLPPYRHLGIVDYNGSPIVVDIGGDGVFEIVNAADNAHVALLRPQLHPLAPGQTEVIWSVEQADLDDERHQMPAAAPIAGTVLIGGGSSRGVFTVRNAATGAPLWSRALSDDETTAAALTQTIALDTDGDGTIEFVTGSEDGVLRALSALQGTLLWSIDLGAPLGDPIAADIDSDGNSEIIVTAADGWLYVIDQSKRRRSVSAR